MKKYLLLLLLVCSGFISFCSSLYFESFYSSQGASSLDLSNYSFNGYLYFTCTGTCSNNTRSIFYGTKSGGGGYIYCDGTLKKVPSTVSSLVFYATATDVTCSFTGNINPCPVCESCPEVDTGAILSGYVLESELLSCQSSLSGCSSSLSSCNSNLSGCMTNLDNYSTSLNTCSTNLNVCNTSLSSCISSNCPTNSGAVSWSSLFVNGIQHLGAPTIRVNIPEEISRDYLSTTEDFVLDVEGYNQDTEYIESVLEVQNYTPTREDFNNTFMLFKSFSGLLVATLFVILVFYFLKKLFK